MGVYGKMKSPTVTFFHSFIPTANQIEVRNSIIMASLLALLGHWYATATNRVEEQEKQLQLQTAQMATARELITDYSNMTTTNLTWLLEDESKAKFLPTLAAITEMRKKIDRAKNATTFLEGTDAQRKCKKEKLHRRWSEVVGLSKKMLTELKVHTELSCSFNSREWGLSEHQIEYIMKSLDFKQRAARIAALANIEQIDKAKITAHAELLLGELTILENELARTYASMAGGRSSCFWGLATGFYPVKTPKRVGEVVEFLVVIPETSLDGGHSNIHLTINGKQHYPDYSGVVRYKGYYSSGRPTVNISYEVLNELTGEVRKRAFKYNFLTGERL